MKLKKQLLRVYDIYCSCEECNEILYEDSSILQRGKIVYTCPKCGKHYYSEEKYPKRVYENSGSAVALLK